MDAVVVFVCACVCEYAREEGWVVMSPRTLRGFDQSGTQQYRNRERGQARSRREAPSRAPEPKQKVRGSTNAQNWRVVSHL